ncbi:hypothetical protein CYMTET_40368 [Cymbomonas tetramitiformis]|uniref:Photosynthesis system II assembly factor Ycf48/Hcf136-like domain-containing protein n=1 Tax=Cymbomonas tetramitiformis TaxID=36881 RepID=A0AAE0CAA3_9CHLO|nr:hypothetical protein CYMTET_40368 [Cymbomonas tetramitiformis]
MTQRDDSGVLHDVDFVSETLGWVVGENAVILHTDDGGDTWGYQHAQGGSEVTWNAVSFATPSRGWVVGTGGRIAFTGNSGQSWRAQQSGTTEQLNDVFAMDASTVWACGMFGVVLYTDDAGSTWSTKPIYIHNEGYSNQALYGMFFASTEVGWVVGWPGRILKTSDAGATWSLQASAVTAQTLHAVFFRGENGWAVGEGGTILATKDAGQQWDPQYCDTVYALNDVVVDSDGKKLWVVARDGSVCYSGDSGDSWVIQGTRWTPLEPLASPEALPVPSPEAQSSVARLLGQWKGSLVGLPWHMLIGGAALAYTDWRGCLGIY